MAMEPERDDSPDAKKEPKLKKIGRYVNPTDETSKVTESLDSPEGAEIESAPTEPMAMSFETEKVSEEADDSFGNTEMISARPGPETRGISGQMTEMVEDVVPEPDTETVTESVEEDGDVLVLLPDEPAFVETQEVAPTSLEDIPLKSTNPLAGTEEIPAAREANPFSGAAPAISAGAGPRGEKIGVIDEIAELATSLDQDILSADEKTAPVEAYQEPPHELPQPLHAAPAARGRRKRSRFLVMTGTLAAAILIGLFVVAELKGWLRTGSPGGAVASAGTGKKSGTPAGKVEKVKTPVDKGGVAVKGGQKPVDGKTPVDGHGAPTELSVTRVAVRQQVHAAVQLGLQGLVKKE